MNTSSETNSVLYTTSGGLIIKANEMVQFGNSFDGSGYKEFQNSKVLAVRETDRGVSIMVQDLDIPEIIGSAFYCWHKHVEDNTKTPWNCTNIRNLKDQGWTYDIIKKSLGYTFGSVDGSLTFFDTPSLMVALALTGYGGKTLLLFHNKIGKWVLPMGKLNHHESFDDAIKREMDEELNIEITEIDFQKTICIGTGYTLGTGKHPLIFTVYDNPGYKGSVSNMEPEKHSKLVWFTKEEIEFLFRNEELDPLTSTDYGFIN